MCVCMCVVVLCIGLCMSEVSVGLWVCVWWVGVDAVWPAHCRGVPITQCWERVLGAGDWALGGWRLPPLPCRNRVWLSEPLVLSGGRGASSAPPPF